jgi:hypothetical protein
MRNSCLTQQSPPGFYLQFAKSGAFFYERELENAAMHKQMNAISSARARYIPQLFE